MKNWKYTSIQHAGRKALQLTPNEYTVLDLIYKMQTYPESPTPGWCTAGVRYFADLMLFGTGGITAMFRRFVEDGLMEYAPGNKQAKRTTPKFYNTAYIDGEDGVQKVNIGVHKVNGTVHKVNGERSQSELIIETNNEFENIESAPAQISQPKDNPIPVTASQAAPDWMDVARQMLEYSRGEGATQYRFLCESMRFSGDPMPVFTAWASKAAPYELKNWKAEFRKLGTWFRNEATRGQAYKPVSNATEQPTIRREL